MKKVVLITGTSSGIGLETALFFHNEGWQVIATMRNPQKRKTELHSIEGIDLIHLDVLDPKSAEQAVEYTIKKYKKIDVLVNNAGYDIISSLEDTTLEQITRQFNTNIIGLIYLTKLVIPYMRENKSGSIVNIASIGGKLAFPLMCTYHSSKHAVEGFSKSLWYELKDYNIKVKVIEPGLIYTNFYSYSLDSPKVDDSNPYKTITENVVKNSVKFGKIGSHPSVVAKTIYKAANSQSYKIHYSTGRSAKLFLWLNEWMPLLFRKIAFNSMAK